MARNCRRAGDHQSSAASVAAVFSSITTGGPHEFLYPSGVDRSTHLAGHGKLHDLARLTGFFTQPGIPLPGASAIFISVLEFVGGILLALGLGSRLIALLFAADMVTAYSLVAALIVFISEPGKFSLDALLAKRFAGGASSPKASSRA